VVVIASNEIDRGMMLSTDSAKLTAKQLEELEAKIDLADPVSKLASIPRDVALIHLLRFYEDYNRLWLPKEIEAGAGSFEVLAKLAQDALHFAVLWIFKYCKPPTAKGSYANNDQLYLLMHDILMQARSYSTVWDIMSLLRRGSAEAVSDQNGTIRIEPIGLLVPDGEVADNVIGIPDDN